MALDPRLWGIIERYAPRFGLDPRAAAAVAMNESGGRFGAVGDNGTSFGPWQLHVGGALPAGRGAAWANSLPGILYALRTMAASGARGLHGQAAVSAIARNFERPADPAAEIATALRYYQTPGFAQGGGAGRGPAPVAGGSVTTRGNPGAAMAALSLIRPISINLPQTQLPQAQATLGSLLQPQQPDTTPMPSQSVPTGNAGSELNAIHSKLLGM